MNRRGFLSDLLKGVVGCAILPSALTYERTWKVVNNVWTPEQLELYNKLPYILASAQFDHRAVQPWNIWRKMLEQNKFPANVGEVCRIVTPLPIIHELS